VKKESPADEGKELSSRRWTTFVERRRDNERRKPCCWRKGTEWQTVENF
jgi:hypothetical protein